MKKTIIIIMILISLLITGCVNTGSTKGRLTEDFCTSVKHSPDAKDASVYIYGNYCVIEVENYNTTYIIDCDFDSTFNLFTIDIVDIIIKTDETGDTESFLTNNDDRLSCTIDEL